MLVDLARTTTDDGVRLDGILRLADSGAQSAFDFDALLCVHGTGGNFYSSGLFDAIGDRFTSLGVAVLRINTRGHDAVSTASTTRGGKRQGAAFERFDDCRYDLAAWTRWLKERGLARVAWAGHSSGALKCVYAAAEEPELAVERVIAISPPRLSHEYFRNSSMGGVFTAAYHRAEEAAREGRGETLMEIRFPLPMLISAAGYLDKYGPQEKYNFLPRVRRVPYPALYIFGSQEVAANVAFEGLPQAVRDAAGVQPATSEVVDGADHFYLGKENELADRITAWAAVRS